MKYKTIIILNSDYTNPISLDNDFSDFTVYNEWKECTKNYSCELKKLIDDQKMILNMIKDNYGNYVDEISNDYKILVIITGNGCYECLKKIQIEECLIDIIYSNDPNEKIMEIMTSEFQRIVDSHEKK